MNDNNILFILELFENKTLQEYFEAWLNQRGLNNNGAKNESMYEEFIKDFVSDLKNQM